jgi:hypothetical protein
MVDGGYKDTLTYRSNSIPKTGFWPQDVLLSTVLPNWMSGRFHFIVAFAFYRLSCLRTVGSSYAAPFTSYVGYPYMPIYVYSMNLCYPLFEPAFGIGS